ncbi:hypothetical protein NQZ68_006103 [Dissostichus eleginoides]|nr:hypothetical protein NQZ68_006103 [Dissostichus eleginoides]
MEACVDFYGAKIDRAEPKVKQYLNQWFKHLSDGTGCQRWSQCGQVEGIGRSLLSLSDSPAGQPANSELASNPLIHSSAEWTLPARQVWVGATQCFLIAAPDT